MHDQGTVTIFKCKIHEHVKRLPLGTLPAIGMQPCAALRKLCCHVGKQPTRLLQRFSAWSQDPGKQLHICLMLRHKALTVQARVSMSLCGRDLDCARLASTGDVRSSAALALTLTSKCCCPTSRHALPSILLVQTSPTCGARISARDAPSQQHQHGHPNQCHT